VRVKVLQAMTVGATGKPIFERLKPSKARGQNFLIQPSLARRIVEAAELNVDDEVVEIGAGLGALTDWLVPSPARRVVAVEVDSRLASFLRERFSATNKVEVICADFLALDLFELAGRRPIKVVGNLPFCAATAILLRLGRWRTLISRMVLMFQREVAERIRAKPGESAYGALSVISAINFSVVDHFRVSSGNFYPRPKVDAEVLVMTPKQHTGTTIGEGLEKLVRASFSCPRKKLRNALSLALKVPSERIEYWLKEGGIDPAARPSDLTLDDFIRLAAVCSGASS